VGHPLLHHMAVTCSRTPSYKSQRHAYTNAHTDAWGWIHKRLQTTHIKIVTRVCVSPVTRVTHLVHLVQCAGLHLYGHVGQPLGGNPGLCCCHRLPANKTKGRRKSHQPRCPSVEKGYEMHRRSKA
jgi:hypothetical protein